MSLRLTLAKWLLGKAVDVVQPVDESSSLMDILRDQIASNSAQQLAQIELQKQIAAQMTAQASVLQSMVDLWKPPAREPLTTSLDERLFAKESKQATDWEPLPANPADIFATLDNDVPFRDLLHEFDSEA